EDQQCAVLVADFAQALQEARPRHAKPNVHEDRLEDDRRDLSRIFLEAPFDGVEIVEGRDLHILNRSFRDAQASWHRRWGMNVSKVWRMGLHTDQGTVVQAMVCAFEFHDLVASRGSARQTDRVHGGFGTAVAEPAHLYWKPVADFFCQFPFHVMRHTEHGSGRQPLFYCFHHRRMAVTRHQRTERQVVVDVLVAVEIAELAAAGLFDEDRPRIISAVVAGYAKRNAFQVFLVRLRGLWGPALKGRKLFLQIGVHRGSPRSSSRLSARLLDYRAACAARLGYSSTSILEVELQCKLHQTWIARLLNHAERCVAKVAVRIYKLRFIEQIENI